MQKVTLPARVSRQGEGYQAAIDNLTFVGIGDTVEEAQDDLVEKFRSWVQSCEGKGTLEVSLSEAGYAQVDEDTELELQFVE
jgi:hypothetical protein